MSSSESSSGGTPEGKTAAVVAVVGAGENGIIVVEFVAMASVEFCGFTAFGFR